MARERFHTGFIEGKNRALEDLPLVLIHLPLAWGMHYYISFYAWKRTAWQTNPWLAPKKSRSVP
jgi:hypothetical protein